MHNASIAVPVQAKTVLAMDRPVRATQTISLAVAMAVLRERAGGSGRLLTRPPKPAGFGRSGRLPQLAADAWRLRCRAPLQTVARSTLASTSCEHRRLSVTTSYVIQVLLT